MKWKHDVSEEYKENRDSLRNIFADGYNFLISLEMLHKQDPNFHFGTAKNLHLYYCDRFLFHLKINEKGPPFPNLVFSSKEHIHIQNGTNPNPELFFDPLSRQVGILGETVAMLRAGSLIVVSPGVKCLPLFQKCLEILNSLKDKVL